MKLIVISFVLFYLFSNAECKHNCIEANYYFSMEESFYPEKDSIKIGDTVWINSQHSTTFFYAVVGLPKTLIPLLRSHSQPLLRVRAMVLQHGNHQQPA